MGKRLGIIAGDGKFPVLLAEEINKNGYISVIVAHTGLTPQYIEKTADKTFWIKVGQLSKLIEIFKSEGITEAIMAGGISKRFMFSDIKPDLRALSLLIRLKDRKDDTILRAIAEELEKEGITVNNATTYIESILAEKEILTKRKLSRDEKKDIDFGFDIANKNYAPINPDPKPVFYFPLLGNLDLPCCKLRVSLYQKQATPIRFQIY